MPRSRLDAWPSWQVTCPRCTRSRTDIDRGVAVGNLASEFFLVSLDIGSVLSSATLLKSVNDNVEMHGSFSFGPMTPWRQGQSCGRANDLIVDCFRIELAPSEAAGFVQFNSAKQRSFNCEKPRREDGQRERTKNPKSAPKLTTRMADQHHASRGDCIRNSHGDKDAAVQIRPSWTSRGSIHPAS